MLLLSCTLKIFTMTRLIQSSSNLSAVLLNITRTEYCQLLTVTIQAPSGRFLVGPPVRKLVGDVPTFLNPAFLDEKSKKPLFYTFVIFFRMR